MKKIAQLSICAITLNAHGARIERLIKSANDNNVGTINIFQGFNGRKWKLVPESAQYKNVKVGNAANCASHIMLLEQQKNKEGYTLILEDDILFADGFIEKLAAAMENMPERDVYFIGWFPFNPYPNHHKYEKTPINKLWSDVTVFHGSFGYIVNNSNIQKIFDTMPCIYDNWEWMLYLEQKKGTLKFGFLTEPLIIHDYAFESNVGPANG